MSITARLPPKADASPPLDITPRIVNSRGPAIVCIVSRSFSFSPVFSQNWRLTMSESGCAMKTSGSSTIVSSAFSRS